MPRVVTPQAYHPSLQFRYKVTTSKLPGAEFYARSAQQPGFENAPVTLEHINYYFKVKGKTRWDDLTMTCYQYEGITGTQFWDYLQQHQAVPGAVDNRAPSYKHDMQIMVLAPDGSTPVLTWKLVGAFFSGVKFGDMDWGTDDPIQVQCTIAFDHAEKA
jgi:hypothetical protein